VSTAPTASRGGVVERIERIEQSERIESFESIDSIDSFDKGDKARDKVKDFLNPSLRHPVRTLFSF